MSSTPADASRTVINAPLLIGHMLEGTFYRKTELVTEQNGPTRSSTASKEREREREREADRQTDGESGEGERERELSLIHISEPTRPP